MRSVSRTITRVQFLRGLAYTGGYYDPKTGPGGPQWGAIVIRMLADLRVLCDQEHLPFDDLNRKADALYTKPLTGAADNVATNHCHDVPKR